jgi:hypothetical protein
MPSSRLEYILDQLQLGQTTGSLNPTVVGQDRVLPQFLCWHTALSGQSMFRRTCVNPNATMANGSRLFKTLLPALICYLETFSFLNR